MLKNRIKQLAAPSGADFDPRFMVKPEDIAFGATNVVEVVQFDQDDVTTADITTLFSLPKFALVDAVYVRVDTPTTAAGTIKIGTSGTINGFIISASITSAGTFLGDARSERGTWLLSSAASTSIGAHLFTAASTVIASLTANNTTIAATVWISYTVLHDPVEEQDFSKPAQAPYFKIREDTEYLSRK